MQILTFHSRTEWKNDITPLEQTAKSNHYMEEEVQMHDQKDDVDTCSAGLHINCYNITNFI